MRRSRQPNEVQENQLLLSPRLYHLDEGVDRAEPRNDMRLASARVCHSDYWPVEAQELVE